jgi:L,D-peptidoglycan transpeptidase YkuD (ErfK/YbiS/YcfS/YnhG family)
VDIVVDAAGELRWASRRYRCALGHGGVRADKREGDGATPAGRFPLRRVLYRPDRLAPPPTRLQLWRADGLYDLIVVIGYNDDPVVPGKGSAIFLHVASPDYRPTHGCVALARDDLLAVLADVGPEVALNVRAADR